MPPEPPRIPDSPREPVSRQGTHNHKPAVTSQQSLPSITSQLPTRFQDLREGGRRQAAVGPYVRPPSPQGSGHGRSEALCGALVSCCRSFKPFPSKLVYSRFPPGSGRLPPDPVLLQWRCSRAFSTCQTRRHRRCPKRAPRRLQEVLQRAQKGPPDHQIPPVFSVF